jgi:hypothetical protein
MIDEVEEDSDEIAPCFACQVLETRLKKKDNTLSTLREKYRLAKLKLVSLFTKLKEIKKKIEENDLTGTFDTSVSVDSVQMS